MDGKLDSILRKLSGAPSPARTSGQNAGAFDTPAEVAFTTCTNEALKTLLLKEYGPSPGNSFRTLALAQVEKIGHKEFLRFSADNLGIEFGASGDVCTSVALQAVVTAKSLEQWRDKIRTLRSRTGQGPSDEILEAADVRKDMLVILFASLLPSCDGFAASFVP